MKQTKFIVLASGKGGTGKTTTALNLGCALTNFGKDVLLVDANLSKPHLGIVLGSPTLQNTINKVFDGTLNVVDSAYLHPSGLKIIPASLQPKHNEDENLKKIRDVLMDIHGAVEIVLIDSYAGVGENAMQTLAAADELIIVTNPELPAVSDALRTISAAEERGVKILGVVVNRVTGEKFELSIKNVEDLLDKKVIGVIPEDSNVRHSISLKQPVVYSHPDSKAAVGFKKLAATLLGQNYEPEVRIPEKSGMLDKIINAVNKLNKKIDKK